MSKPTRKEILEYQRFRRRQKVYETKYRKQFNSWLNAVNKSAAKNYIDGNMSYDINSKRLERIYTNLYKEVTLNEASIQWALFDIPKTKDIINVLAGVLVAGESEPISLWRSLLNEFITTRIAGRIVQVEQTTRKRIAEIIEKGINEGLDIKEVAKLIRKDFDFNKNRSLAIARTETVTSANQGKYMAAVSSPYVKMKKWLPANDDRTRLSHIDFLDRPFVEMGQKFFVANAKGVLEEANFPCDVTLSASNVVNCRCVIIFKNKVDSRGLPIRK